MVVATRGSARKASRATRSSPTADEAREVAAASATPKSREREQKKSSAAKARSRKEELGQALRQKSTGYGLSISLDKNDSEHVNRKIVFDADAIDTEPNETPVIELEERFVHKASDDEDDNDDAVEEVQQGVAREYAQAEQMKQRVSMIANRSILTKRRKRKNKSVDLDDEDDNDSVMSSLFFAELDSELAQDRKRTKNESRFETSKPIGKHTTFVVQGEDHVRPVQVNDNIQLVIWNEANREESTDPKKLSEQSLIYSRSRLTDGKDKLSHKKRQQAKKAGRKTVESDGWTRSTKMNRLLFPGRRAMRKAGTGSAAPRFIVQAEP